MATITTQTSGSPLIGSPIVYEIQAGYYPESVFHRVKLQVVAGLQGAEYTTIEMSVLAIDDESGELLRFDISSALRAVADDYIYSPVPPENYPYIQYYLVAWDEYMINGVTYESNKDYFPDNYPTSPLRALIGNYTDMERLLAGNNKQAQVFSRKPTNSPELVMVGETFVKAIPFDNPVHSGSITQGQISRVYTVQENGLIDDDGQIISFSDANVYAIAPGNREGYQIRFINGLGAMESISVQPFKHVETNITTSKFTRAIQESFGNISRAFAVKSNDYEVWNLSSRPLDKLWKSWFVHEFLLAKWVWIGIRANQSEVMWLPCHIIPEETTEIIDETGGMFTVNFSVQLDIIGSPLYQLAV